MAKVTYNRNCLYCQKEFIANDKQKKYCNLSCANRHRGATNQRRIRNEGKYNLNPKLCVGCKSPISYDDRLNSYCSQSCGATHSNQRKDWTKIKTGPKPSHIPKKKWIPTKKSKCEVCDISFIGLAKTCSRQCYRKLLSQRMKTRIYDGFNPNLNRGRHKQSYMESSFEKWFLEKYPQLTFHMEHKFKRLDIIKTYYADFYFPNLNLIIELDGSQHQSTKKYDQDRDNYISKNYNVQIIRISHKEYQSLTKMQLIQNILEVWSRCRILPPGHLVGSQRFYF